MQAPGFPVGVTVGEDEVVVEVEVFVVVLVVGCVEVVDVVDEIVEEVVALVLVIEEEPPHAPMMFQAPLVPRHRNKILTKLSHNMNPCSQGYRKLLNKKTCQNR